MVTVIKGAHNALTSGIVKNWWGIFGLPIAKCQDKEIISLLNRGITCFDLRVYLDKKTGVWLPAHGLINFKMPNALKFGRIRDTTYDLWEIIELIDNRCKDGEAYIRLILEKGDDEERFWELCQELDSEFKGINFIGGYKKKGWKLIYDFFDNNIPIEQQVSSMDPRAKGKWYKYFPYIFAKKFTMNKPWEPINKYEGKVIILRDFC